jgi:nucleotide-binding universal stress UspA family protein
MTSVVAGVDGSTAADIALRWALRAAAVRGAGLTAVRAFRVPALRGPLDREIDLDDVRTEARTRVTEALARATGDGPLADVDVDIDTIALTERRNIADALLRHARGAELLVVGARGLGGFAGLLLGSVSQQVAAHARIPVAVVPDGRSAGSAGSDGAVRSLVVGVDGSPHSIAALRWAVHEATLQDCPLTAVHVTEPPAATLTSDVLRGIDEATMDAFWTYGMAEARDALDEVVDKVLVDTDVEVERVVVVGRPGHELLRRAAGPDVLVVGSRGRGGFPGLVLGSVSQRCLYHARSPVVVHH